jgi:hypothetical protein
MSTTAILPRALKLAARGHIIKLGGLYLVPRDPEERGVSLEVFLKLCRRGDTLAVQVQLTVSPIAAEALARDLGRLAAEAYVAGKLALGGAQ